MATNQNIIPESELILNKDGSVYHLSLLPEHLSDVIITVGDPNRVGKVTAHFDEVTVEINKREFVTHIGTYKGKRMTVMSTGMGTDNIEILMNELDALANIDLTTRQVKDKHRSLKIIRIGTSGALRAELEVGTHLVSQYAVGLDTLMYFYALPQTEQELWIGDELREALGLSFTPYCVEGAPSLLQHICEDMVIGNTVTCPGFYAPQGRKLRSKLRHPSMVEDLAKFNRGDFQLTNFEMETAGYYSLGRILGHEVLSVNAIIANRVTQKFATDADAIVDALIVRVLDRAAML